MSASRRSVIIAVALGWLLTVASPVSGQQVSGHVVESDRSSPVPGATILALDTTFVLRDRVRADSAGAFTFTELTAGVYLFQAIADGRSGFVSQPVTVTLATASSLTLVVPSAMHALAMRCPVRGSGVLVGLIRETSGVPLPGARVAMHWDGLPDTLVATTDAMGRYRFCSVPTERPLGVRIELLGHRLDTTVQITQAGITRADFELGLGAGGSSLRIVRTSERDTLVVGAAISGVLLDSDTREPIAGALVEAAGEQFVSSHDGRFQLGLREPGQVVLQVEHLAYGTQREVLTLSPRMHVDVELILVPTAIVLESIEAVGNARELFDRRAMPERVDVVAGAELALEEARGGRIASIVAPRFPSLKVSEGRFISRYGISRGVCMESTRRIMSLSAAATGDGNAAGSGDIRSCNTIEVVVDDVRVSDPVGFLGTVNLSDFESISFMSAVSAGIRYGRNAGEYGGVLLLWTRGRGPYTSQARNTPPE